MEGLKNYSDRSSYKKINKGYLKATTAYRRRKMP